MGSKKSVKTPPAPDPAPAVTDPGTERTESAKRQEQRRILNQFGRRKTILADETDRLGGGDLLGG